MLNRLQDVFKSFQQNEDVRLLQLPDQNNTSA